MASVGWAVVDDEGKLLNFKNRYWYGVRLFEDAAEEKNGKPKNLSRRNARHFRRLVRRRALRNNDFIDLIVNKQLVESKTKFYELIKNNSTIPLDLRIKGLKEKLSNSELCVALFNYLQHRGFFYDIPDEQVNDDNEQEKTKLDKSIEEIVNNSIKSGKKPSEIQKEFYSKDGYYVGHPCNLCFSNKCWESEIRLFLSNQQLDDDFKEKYIHLFTRVRDYSKGPGSEKSPTKYGLFIKNKDGKIEKKGESLWETTIGKCTVYENEFRSVKKSGSAELFNLLNDLNNLRLRKEPDWRINQKLKEEIVKYCIEKGKLTKKGLSKIIKCDIDEIFGYRIDKNKKFIIEDLSNIRTIFHSLKLENFNPWQEPEKLNIVNKLVECKSKEKNKDKLRESCRKEISNFGIKIDSNELDGMIDEIKGYTQTHAFSIKFLNECIPQLFKSESGENQQNILIKRSLNNQNKIKNLYINPNKALKNLVVSPTAKRSIRQTIEVFNKIIKFLHNDFSLKSIAIEMAREKNSSDEQKKVNDLQKLNENRRKEVEKWIRNSKWNGSLKDKVIYKLCLLIQQEYKDIYDNNDDITLEEVLEYPNNFDVDHIIPYSKSLMDNKNNKVLTRKSRNKEKGDQTPYQWFEKSGKSKDFERLNDWWKKLFSKKEKDKFNNLTYRLDPLEDFENFIGRNLADTRASTSCLLDIFRAYKNGHDLNDMKMELFSINGLVTNYVRKDLWRFIPRKQRELYRHHADDALVLAYLSTKNFILKAYRFFAKYRNNFENYIIDKETGELRFDRSELINNFANLYANIKLSENPPTFSRQINNCRSNVQFFGETIYSGIQYNNKIRVIKKLDLLKSDVKKLGKFFGENPKKQNDLFIFNSDKKLYYTLSNIYKEYYLDNTNPFQNYLNKNPEYKQGENLLAYVEDSEIKIRRLRYYSSEINSYFVNTKLKQSSKYVSFFTEKNNIGFHLTKKDQKWEIQPITIDFGFNKKKNLVYVAKYTLICLKNQPLSKGMFYIVGVPSRNRVEIKPIMCYQRKLNFYNKEINPDYKVRQGQYTIALDRLIEDFDYIETDILGNVYNRMSFDKRFSSN